MNQLFFIEGRYMGEGRRPDLGQGGGADSFLFFCYFCGDVFARCPTVPSSPWTSFPSCCRKCHDTDTRAAPFVSGSIWTYESPFVAAFPDAVLRWEVDRHLEHALKEMNLEGN